MSPLDLTPGEKTGSVEEYAVIYERGVDGGGFEIKALRVSKGILV
jgi:hypothetical protein